MPEGGSLKPQIMRLRQAKASLLENKIILESHGVSVNAIGNVCVWVIACGHVLMVIAVNKLNIEPEHR